MEQILSNIKREDIDLVLLRNKCNMESRAFTEAQGNKMAEELKVSYF